MRKHTRLFWYLLVCHEDRKYLCDMILILFWRVSTAFYKYLFSYISRKESYFLAVKSQIMSSQNIKCINEKIISFPATLNRTITSSQLEEKRWYIQNMKCVNEKKKTISLLPSQKMHLFSKKEMIISNQNILSHWWILIF